MHAAPNAPVPASPLAPFLAQEAPGLAGQPMSAPAPAGGTVEGGGTPVGAPAPTGGDSSLLFLLMVAFVAVLLGTQIFAARKDRKRRDALMSGLKRNDRVQTAGGVIGSVVEVKPETVVLKVDEHSNTRITFAKSAVTAVLTSAPAEAADAKG